MSVHELVELVSNAAKGLDNFKKGAIGSNGYGFVIKDSNSKLPYVKFIGSSLLCCIGALRNFMKNFIKRVNDIGTLQDILSCRDYDDNFDMLLLGALKTLVPSLQFGGDVDNDTFFNAWMFVRTPEGKQFPTTLYYRKGAVSVGCWDLLRLIDETTNKAYFPAEFMEVVNCSPLEFTEEELNMFVDALEFALEKVPVSDFWGFYYEDTCILSLGVHTNEPFVDRIGYPEKKYLIYEKKLEPLLGKQFINEWGNIFTIHKLPRELYYIDYSPRNLELFNFGNAKKIYEEYKREKVNAE